MELIVTDVELLADDRNMSVLGNKVQKLYGYTAFAGGSEVDFADLTLTYVMRTAGSNNQPIEYFWNTYYLVDEDENIVRIYEETVGGSVIMERVETYKSHLKPVCSRPLEYGLYRLAYTKNTT